MNATEKHARTIAKLKNAALPQFGKVVVPSIPGTVFDPLALFLDPGKLPALLQYWENRSRRDGCGDGLPKHLRKAACENAAQVCLSYFIDADYKALGITADEVVRAILMAYRLARRRFWKDAAAHADRERERAAQERGAWFPYNRAQNSRTADPKRIFHAASAMGMETAVMVNGEGCDDIPGDTVAIPGGPSGRGETDGKMVPTMKVLRSYVVNGEELADIETGWKMRRGRGKARKLPPCTVNAGKPENRGRYRRPAAGKVAAQRESGERSMIPNYAPDVEAYRAALAEYYGGR
jgi:hypothetical protein